MARLAAAAFAAGVASLASAAHAGGCAPTACATYAPASPAYAFVPPGSSAGYARGGYAAYGAGYAATAYASGPAYAAAPGYGGGYAASPAYVQGAYAAPAYAAGGYAVGAAPASYGYGPGAAGCVARVCVSYGPPGTRSRQVRPESSVRTSAPASMAT